MFTGIILAVGQIAALQTRGGDCRLSVNTGSLALTDCALGDSIAVNGVCLTAVELAPHQFVADVSNETLARTTLQQARVGTAVNLELALTPSSRLGGHIVSGHVDGIGRVVGMQADGRSQRLTIQAPDDLAKYIAEKGSICIDGISLTVNAVDGACFTVNIVPHTWQMTTLASAHIGMQLNLEVDLLARYLERLMTGGAAPTRSGVTHALLQASGFMT
jgi:riboflavin synthase